MSIEATTIRKVSQRLVPFLFVLYVVCFLDRVNVGFAALQMNRDLNLSAGAYGLGAGIFFIGYALFEVPSNILLHRVGARLWIARIAITWGLLSTAMMFVSGAASFYAIRFLLGVAEAGFFPGIIYYMSNWFPADARAKAISWFMTAIPISAVLGGPISGMILGLNGVGGLAGWRWLFLLEGLPSVVLGIAVFWALTERPADAKWLTADERTWLETTLEAEHRRRQQRHGVSLRAMFAHRTVWELGALYAVGSAGTYGLALWLPQIIKSFSGSSDFAVGMMSAAPNLVAAVAMVAIAASSDRSGERCMHIAWCSLAAAAGFVVSAFFSSPMIALSALSLAAVGINGRYGPFWALPSKFLGDEAAAGGIAFINSFGAISGFVAPYVIGLVRDVTGSFRGGLLFLALLMFLSAVMAAALSRRTVLQPVLTAAEPSSI
ncbi:MAG TPA: MFS transporter [Gemmatimonadaceae bacterium]|nr:MFS transporter [Gemmatimonadaceae bacterium]